MILLQGAPKTGKSQLLRIASALVPDTARCVVPPNEWSDRFMPAMMNEKLINVCGELSEKKKIDGMKFKDIVDGSEMSGQIKGKDIFQFRRQFPHLGPEVPRTNRPSTPRPDAETPICVVEAIL